MKIEFGNIGDKHIGPGMIFYLYGNHKKTLNVFCDFLLEKFAVKFPKIPRAMATCTLAEYDKLRRNQCDLFESKTTFYCIRNLEDRHWEKASHLSDDCNDVFILESGDYGKSKAITENIVKSAGIYAIASFKNDITLASLCQMMLPHLEPPWRREILKIIANTDEELSSLFRKISLLMDEQKPDMLKEYVTHRESFLQDMDFIPLVRYLLKLSVAERIFDRKPMRVPFDLSRPHITEKLLKAEMLQKTNAISFGKNYIYNAVSGFFL